MNIKHQRDSGNSAASTSGSMAEMDVEQEQQRQRVDTRDQRVDEL